MKSLLVFIFLLSLAIPIQIFWGLGQEYQVLIVSFMAIIGISKCVLTEIGRIQRRKNEHRDNG